MITAAEAKAASQKVRTDLADKAFNGISNSIQNVIAIGGNECRIEFPGSVKVEVIKKLEELGYRLVGSGNFSHNGKYTIKISW